MRDGSLIVFNFDLEKELSPWGSPEKRKRTQDGKYLKFFAERNPFCCVPGCNNPSTLDHVIAGRSRNSKASDYLIVNICLGHHLPKGSNKLFQLRNKVNFAKIIERNLKAYALSKGISGVFNSLRELEAAF